MTVKYPGESLTTNGNQLVANTEARIADCGVFYPITPSTEQGETFEFSVARGKLTVFGDVVKAIEAEGEHAAQGGAIAMSVTGKRVSNFTSGQGIVYGLEQYYHAPGKLSTMVLNVGARALTKHALNVHCGHDDIMAALDSGWTMLMAKDAQQACDQSIILRKVCEQSLTPGMNIQDGFLTTHLERTFLRPESELLREFLGHPADEIDTPTEDQKELFGAKRRRVPVMYDLHNPLLLGSVQNQEHYMTGVIARRKSFNDYILGFLQEAYDEFAQLTGRSYGFLSEYNCEGAETVFLSLGSSAENIEAATDYIQKKHGEKVGIIHLNVLRPLPENAIIKALRGKKNVIILERTDESMSGCNPLAREIRATLSKANENSRKPAFSYLETLPESETPRIFEGVYGLGSRDFRPEGILGAYEFVKGKVARQDGRKESDGESFFYIGVNHPYAVESAEKPSLLPESAIAIRIHSVGGWGAITTGKNMAEILGELSKVSPLKKDQELHITSNVKYGSELHISANPKYGSEKKGAPTNYFLVVANERVKVNCELKHVDVVLCCDPKIFTHMNPLEGIKEGGSFVWENVNADEAWQRIPQKYRQEIMDKKIQLYALNGFEIARSHTPREDLQTRMQGNAFLGGFFKVSSFLKDNGISKEMFLETVLNQYNKKFGKLGKSVVEANLDVMKSGFDGIKDIKMGTLEGTDTSAMEGSPIKPLTLNCETCSTDCGTAPIFQLENYRKEFLEGDKYNQKASPLTATGVIPAGTGAQASKFVSRIKVPVFDPYKCTQCMNCIKVCPDTALPNTAQDIPTYINNIFENYVQDESDRKTLMSATADIAENIRGKMKSDLDAKVEKLGTISDMLLTELETVSLKQKDNTINEVKAITATLPLGYGKTKTIFQSLEKKTPGEGGIFSIFVSDLCKGCGECVEACGDHEALVMVDEDEHLRAKHLTAMDYFDTLPRTPNKYLGKFDPANIEESKAAVLQNHLMIQEYYDSFVSGDGACAGCGEKSILRGVVTMTEALMKPVMENKSKRLWDLAQNLKKEGLKRFEQLKTKKPEAYDGIRLSILHLLMGFGAEDIGDVRERIANEFKGSEKDLIDALVLALETESQNCKKLEIIDGEYNGMSAMAMTANTGCNTVFGSTHPANPHAYPWMNSLFQDGTTIGWLVAESFMMDHARRSVIPERLGRHIFDDNTDFSEGRYQLYAHLDDSHMTDQEILELPKVWAVGGDGALGDIGFQNLSKVVLQNRPNVNILMLDTQVYSNTGGQNSDSSIMPGGFDMNQYANIHHQGKMTERKEVAQILTAGHGSPFVASVSMANAGSFFKAVLDGLTYRGSSFIQSFTTCQPEHGVPDYASALQARRARDSRGMPEFTYNPQLGELDGDCFSLKPNPMPNRDWAVKKDKDGKPYDYNIIQWAYTEGRFKKHFSKIKPEEETMSVDEILGKVNQMDITNRYFLDKDHEAHIPLRGLYTDIVIEETGARKRVGVSRHLVLFTIERRRNWRRLQARANIRNPDLQP